MAATTRPAKKNRRLNSKGARLLHARTPVAIRRIARTFLAAARRARRRLQADGDEEALHDFRVALRRLRSTLRIYRPVVDGLIPRKWRRRLKRLARATGAARDAEVGLAWMHRQQAHTTEAEREACDKLIAEWSARRDKAYAKLRRTLDEEFTPLDEGLSMALAAPSGHVTASMLAPTAGTFMHEQIAALATRLHGIAAATDTRTIHTARVEGKRLRYLIEPFAAEVTNGKALLKSLKRFQDEFGELCDRQMLSEELIEATARYEAERSAREMREIFDGRADEPVAAASTTNGLRALASRLNAERQQLFAHIERHYLGQQTDAFLAPYRALANTLVNTPAVPRIKKKIKRGAR